MTTQIDHLQHFLLYCSGGLSWPALVRLAWGEERSEIGPLGFINNTQRAILPGKPFIDFLCSTLKLHGDFNFDSKVLKHVSILIFCSQLSEKCKTFFLGGFYLMELKIL